jgi:hypothetical protein
VSDVAHGLRRDEPVELAVDSIGGVLAVAVQGELVGAAGDPLKRCLWQAVRRSRPVVVDLTAVRAIDRRSVDALLGANRAPATRLRIIVERGGELHQALRRHGVAHVLALHGSRAEALAAVSPR